MFSGEYIRSSIASSERLERVSQTKVKKNEGSKKNLGIYILKKRKLQMVADGHG